MLPQILHCNLQQDRLTMGQPEAVRRDLQGQQLGPEARELQNRCILCCQALRKGPARTQWASSRLDVQNKVLRLKTETTLFRIDNLQRPEGAALEHDDTLPGRDRSCQPYSEAGGSHSPPICSHLKRKAARLVSWAYHVNPDADTSI